MLDQLEIADTGEFGDQEGGRAHHWRRQLSVR